MVLKKSRLLAGIAAIGIAVSTSLLGGAPATAATERPDSLGKDFWVTFPQNYDRGSTLSLFISSPYATSGKVEIPGLSSSQDFSVTPGNVATVPIPNPAQLGLGADGLPQNLGIHVTAADEVGVYGLNRKTATTDAYLGLPTDVLGTEHIVLAWPGPRGFSVSETAVLATKDNTAVTFVPTANTTSGVAAGETKNVTLNAGEALPISSQTGDLSGTTISSDKPVAVFGGHQCADVPDKNYPACDHLVEQLPPTSTWGKEFLTVPLKTRKKGDTFRMIASEDGTKVSVNGSPVANLDKGQLHEQIIDGQSEITSNKPILVAQFSNGQDYDDVISDPFMMLTSPKEQFLSNYTFTTPASGFPKHFVNVVIPTSATSSLKLDGADVPPAAFTPIGASGYSGAQLDLETGSHTMSSGTPFGISIYGFGDYDSYGYPGGAAYAPINEATGLTLTPPSQTATINTQACVDAKVVDQNGKALPGIPLQMSVTGANPATGSDITGSNGVLNYCYTGTNAGVDTVKASFDQLAATATIEWTAGATPSPTVSPAKAQRLPINTEGVKGRTARIGSDNKIVLVKHISTNKHGKIVVRAFCRPVNASSAGEVRFCKATVTKRGKVTVRAGGYPAVRVVVKARAVPKKGQEDQWLPNRWRKVFRVTR